jgi:SH3-like domain-containing protein
MSPPGAPAAQAAAPVRAAQSDSAGAPRAGRTLAVGTAVANLRREPSHAAELVSQLVLGEPVRLLQEMGGWLRVAGRDGYEGWVDGRSLAEDVSQAAARALVWTHRSGLLRETAEPAAAPLCDLVVGARATPAGDPSGHERRLREVILPGGTRGWAEADGWVPEPELPRRFPRSPLAVCETALSLRGVPYLWGGTSSKAFDCSGFAQRVFGLHGVALPRDAWQQAEVGDRVEPGEAAGSLRAADLVFFAEEGTRVTHVAIALGERGRVVHCSTSHAGVAVDGLDPSDPIYAPSLAGTIVFGRRLF